MEYSKRDLRNNNLALLKRLDRKMRKKESVFESVEKKDKKDKIKDLFKDEFDSEKKDFTRLGLYNRRKGKRF